MADKAADQAAHHSDYRLKVTAGPSYDVATHQVVPVNNPKSLTFENDHVAISLAVRVRHFTGFPPDSPETSDYFEHPLHIHDQYSISLRFVPKKDISGNELVFGNDFERPIRDRLPPGFNQALKIVKWWIDPGLEGDAYADKPYLYGPALSSWNIFWVGDKVFQDEGQTQKWEVPDADSFHKTIVEEGGDEEGVELRTEQGIPEDSAGRKKYFLTESHREKFTFEAGRLYQCDFGNPYLDFNDFSLKLPGFSLNVIQYVDTTSHELRYTLKNKATGDVYAVVMFTLLFGNELEQEEKKWPETGTASKKAEIPDARKEEPKPSAESNDIDDEDDEGVD